MGATHAVRKGVVQLKGAVHVTGPLVPFMGSSAPLTHRPSIPLTGSFRVFLDCQIVGHTSGKKNPTNINVAENFVPALESLSSLGFEERNPGCPGNFAGMSRTPGGVQKVCAKKLRAHFSFPT